MHLTQTMKHWSHHLHDDMLKFEHAVSMNIRSRTFWIGVGVTMLLIGLMTLLLIWAYRMPAGTFDGFDFSVPYMYYRV